MYLVPDSKTCKEFQLGKISAVMKDGYEIEDLTRAVEKAYPEFDCNPVVYASGNGIWAIIFIFLLGGSILVTGLSGFLKMQLQLFVLRNREMALRLQNGGKQGPPPSH